MPYNLVHNGVMREFDFYAPPAWEYWVARAWKDHGRIGLPVVVALHGAGQDPLEFQEKWFFPEVWNRDLEGNALIEYPEPTQEAITAFVDALETYQRLLDNQFFILYPYGMGWTSTSYHGLGYNLTPLPAIPGSPPGTTFRPLYREDRATRGWSTGVDGVATGPAIDDVGFINEMLRVIGEKLRAQILSAKTDIDAVTAGNPFPWQTGGHAPATLFDVDRRYLFGYSNGGMMAHRLVNQMPNHWAAIWGMATSVGGQAHQGFGKPVENVPVNKPVASTHTVSLFAHHGEKDEIAPPATVVSDPLATTDFVLQSPKINSPVYLQYQLAGFGTPEERKRYMPAFLPLAQGWRKYAAYNNLPLTTTREERSGLYKWKGGSSQGSAYSYSAAVSRRVPAPVGGYAFAANPIAVMYVDPDMTHTNFTSHENRYFFAADVWQFLRCHPRTMLR